MAGSATITGTQNYIMGIGHPKTEATTEAPPAVFATDLLTGGILGLVGASGQNALPFVGSISTTVSLAAATANTAVLQAALNAGGLVQVQSAGTYYINDALTIYGNTKLTLGPSVVFKSWAGVNKNILVNAGYLRATSAATVTWSAGYTVSVAWTAHGRSVGDFVSVAGLSTSEYVGVFPVTAVADANNLTLMLYRIPAAVPTGTAAVKVADVNIEIDGFQYDYNYTGGNNDSAQVQTRIGVILGYLANSSVKNLYGVDVNKYVLCVGAASNVIVENIDFANTQSDGVKVYGPVYGVNVSNIYGTPKDDTFSFQTREPDAFVGYRFTEGDVLSSTVSKVGGYSSGSGTVVLYGSPNQFMDDVKVSDVSGNAVAATVAVTGSTGYVGQFGKIEIGGLSGTAARAVSMAYINFEDIKVDGQRVVFSSHGITVNVGGSVTGKRLKCSRVHHLTDATTKYSVNMNNITLEHLIVEELINGSAIAGSYPVQMASGAIDTISFLNNTLRSSQRGFDINSGAVRKINAYGNTMNGTGDQLMNIGASVTGTPLITLTSNETDSAAVISANAACEIALSGNRFASNSNGVVRITGSISVQIRSDGTNQFKNAAHVVVVSGTPTILIYGWDIGVDPIALTGLATTNGQYLLSTQATIEGGPTVRTAAGWVAIGTGAAGVNTVIT